MRLTIEGIKDKESWANAGIALPQYDIEAVAEKTKKSPVWLHFGAGNIFRGYIAGLQDTLLNHGEAETGVIAAETFDYDIIDKIYTPYDNLTLLVTLKPDGTTAEQVLAGIAEGIKADSSSQQEMSRLKEIFTSKSLQMVSFTVTEKGYALKDMEGSFLPIVEQDIEEGPESARHAMSIVTAMLYERYQAGRLPIAMVSMDNCSHNGEKLKNAVMAMADAWKQKRFVEEGFLVYLEDEGLVSFPFSMIDKITPRPAKIVEEKLEGKGVEAMAPVVTARNTFIAPFVNAEGPQYLVVEDKFPNGRPALQKAGVYLTDRDTVNKVERMKVTTCLNPLHTALAVYGCVLGYRTIAEEMKDRELSELVRKIGYEEGMKVVTDPGILSPKAFIDEVIEERLPNPFIPDVPQRIATDTSQKIPVRYGETIKSYVKDPELSPESLTFIPLAIAGWFRYLLGVDDNLNPMELSQDPMLPSLKEQLKGIRAGEPESYHGQLKDILGNEALFGISLYEAGIADKVEAMFIEELAGAGAVRETLKKYLG